MTTTLEAQFMQTLKEEAYGGTLFVQDINPKGMDKKQKSGVVSSLVKKGVLETNAEYGQLAIILEGEEVYEISQDDVQKIIDWLEM